MVKASINGDGDFFILSEILDGLKLSMKQFHQMCIAAGCDYLSNIRGVGIQRAFEMVASHGDLLELLSRRGASQEYKACFGRVEAVFQHQTVFNLSTCTTVPLERWETDPSSDLQNLCGKYPFSIYPHHSDELRYRKLCNCEYISCLVIIQDVNVLKVKDYFVSGP